VQSHSGCTRTQSLAGANKGYQIVEGGCGVVVERGLKEALSHLSQGQVLSCSVDYSVTGQQWSKILLPPEK
jgi:hypothetical protein